MKHFTPMALTGFIQDVARKDAGETGSGFKRFNRRAEELERGQIDSHVDDASTAMDMTEGSAAL